MLKFEDQLMYSLNENIFHGRELCMIFFAGEKL